MVHGLIFIETVRGPLRPACTFFFFNYYICTHFLKGNYSRNSFLTIILAENAEF